MNSSTKLNEFDHSFIYGRTSEGMSLLPELSPESAALVFNNMAPDLVGRIRPNDGSSEEVRLRDVDSSTQA